MIDVLFYSNAFCKLYGDFIYSCTAVSQKQVKHHNKKGFLSRSFAYFALNPKTFWECLWFIGSQEPDYRLKEDMTPPNADSANHTPGPFIHLWEFISKNQSHLLLFHLNPDATAERITRAMSKLLPFIPLPKV